MFDSITAGPSGPTLANIEPPEIDAETVQRKVDLTDLPDGVTEADVSTETYREYAGMPEKGYRKHQHHVIDVELIGEAVAKAKIAYCETRLARVECNVWNGEPLALDALLAATAEAGLDGEGTRQAIAVPATLDRFHGVANDSATMTEHASVTTRTDVGGTKRTTISSASTPRPPGRKRG